MSVETPVVVAVIAATAALIVSLVNALSIYVTAKRHKSSTIELERLRIEIEAEKAERLERLKRNFQSAENLRHLISAFQKAKDRLRLVARHASRENRIGLRESLLEILEAFESINKNEIGEKYSIIHDAKNEAFYVFTLMEPLLGEEGEIKPEMIKDARNWVDKIDQAQKRIENAMSAELINVL